MKKKVVECPNCKLGYINIELKRTDEGCDVFASKCKVCFHLFNEKDFEDLYNGNLIILNKEDGMISNRGNVEDIKCSLEYSYEHMTLEDFERELVYEQKNKNRQTVVKLFKRAIRYKKLKRVRW